MFPAPISLLQRGSDCTWRHLFHCPSGQPCLPGWGCGCPRQGQGLGRALHPHGCLWPLAASPAPCFPCQAPSRHVFLTLLTALATTNRASCNAEHLGGCRALLGALQHTGLGRAGHNPSPEQTSPGGARNKLSPEQTSCAVTVVLAPLLHSQPELSLVLPGCPDSSTDTAPFSPAQPSACL